MHNVRSVKSERGRRTKDEDRVLKRIVFTDITFARVLRFVVIVECTLLLQVTSLLTLGLQVKLVAQPHTVSIVASLRDNVLLVNK